MPLYLFYAMVQKSKKVKRKLSPGRQLAEYQAPNFHNRFHFPFMEIAENVWVLGIRNFCMESVAICSQKHASTLGAAVVTRGGRGQLKTKCLF